MRLEVLLFIANTTLLLLHEVDSAYEREWEILNLPGKISGFLIIHIPIILLLLYGLVEFQNGSRIGEIIAIVAAAGGILPLLLHKLILPRKDRFSRLVSDVIIYTNAVAGSLLLVLSIRLLASHV